MIKNAFSTNVKRQKHHDTTWRIIFACGGGGGKNTLPNCPNWYFYELYRGEWGVFFFFKGKVGGMARNETAFLASLFDY